MESALALPTASDDAPKVPVLKSWMRHGALILDEESDTMLGGMALGLDTDIDLMLCVSLAPDVNPWMGFILRIPLGSSNEDDGIGMRYNVDRSAQNQAKPATHANIVVKFPRGQATRRFDTLVGETRALFPAIKIEMSVLEVSLVDGARVGVEGYGFQFANPGHPAEDWIVRQGPVGAGKTLLDIFEQRTFKFVVKSPAKQVGLGWNETNMPPAFNLPYGSVHDWHVGMYEELIEEAQGPKFAPFWSFEDDNEHVAAKYSLRPSVN
ncbi:DNA helicase [Ilyonectria robusta]